MATLVLWHTRQASVGNICRSVSNECVIKEELLDIVPLKDRTRDVCLSVCLSVCLYHWTTHCIRQCKRYFCIMGCNQWLGLYTPPDRSPYRHFHVQISFKFPHNLWRARRSSHGSWSRETQQALFNCIIQWRTVWLSSPTKQTHVLCFHCKTHLFCRFTCATSTTYSAVHCLTLFFLIPCWYFPNITGRQWKDQP